MTPPTITNCTNSQRYTSYDAFGSDPDVVDVECFEEENPPSVGRYIIATPFVLAGCSGIPTIPVDAGPDADTHADAEAEHQPPPIDPSQDCAEYSSEQILDEVGIFPGFGTEILPGEREQIREVLSSIDYRFTQGLTEIRINERDTCSSPGNYLFTDSPEELTAALSLCRDSNGENGAFTDLETLYQTMYDLISRHVIQKIGDRVAEYYHLTEELPDGRLLNESDFSRDFATYLLNGRLFRFGADRYEEMDLRYNWLKENIFCEREYGFTFTDIDPSEDCSEYPLGEIAGEYTVEANPAFTDEEIARVRSIFESIDYRFSQGIHTIELFQHEPCSVRGVYGDNTIGLCWSSDGSGGAFEDDNTLLWTIHHETGHHVDWKIDARALEYYSLMPEGVLAAEAFAEDFARYILGGPHWRLEGIIDESQRIAYDWFNVNIFCGRDYEENQIDGIQYRYANMLQDHALVRDCERAIEEYQRLIDNFPESDYVPTAYIEMASSYACLDNCDRAIEILEQVKIDYPDRAPDAQFEIAATHTNCLGDWETAIFEYRRIVDEYPDSSAAPRALLEIGQLSERLYGCASAILVYEELIDSYPDFFMIDSALFNLGSCYFELRDCTNAVIVLERLIDEYPTYPLIDRARDIVDFCS